MDKSLHTIDAKAQVRPKNFVSIPRLELVVAVLLMKETSLIKKELGIDKFEENIWTDNKVFFGRHCKEY